MTARSTPNLAAELAYETPGDVPVNHVGKVVSAAGDEGGGTVTVDTDAGEWVCQVAAEAHGYGVADIEPVQ